MQELVRQTDGEFKTITRGAEERERQEAWGESSRNAGGLLSSVGAAGSGGLPQPSSRSPASSVSTGLTGLWSDSLQAHGYT